uniref:OSJNBa0089N06.2 protein n=1 Tax=Oryza sativa subsp. japonica TaxID=39947 RepID=Q7X918_ORYSJ|nr:OSJNBa0089N06.2 [Oryza sativa Japonica Group]CAI44664.1 OSJNBb0060E08.23 [Oryza sativa Japonica Group]
MATVKLPMWTNPETITKVVMSASPAAADGDGGGGITVAAIARADPIELYAVTEAEEIFAFDDADIEHYSHLPSDQWRWTHVDKQAPAFGRTEFYLVACHTMGKVLVVSRDFGRARVPDTGGGRAAARYHTSRFKVGSSVQEAKQMAAWEAVTFLRSRFRSVLDDSPWSSIPHYHSHVSEIEYDEDFDDDFDYADL